MNKLFSVLTLLGCFINLATLHAQYEGNSPFCHQGGGLFINEISNGPSTGQGNQEYIELVVTPDPADPLAPVNLEGWILDDNNVAASDEGNAAGHFVLGSCYQAVPPGSILVLYNPQDANTALPPDDPTDADQDGVYIIPADSDCVLSCNSNPTTEDSDYCPCSDPSAPVSAWQIGLRNSGDVFQVRDGCETVVHAISWGSAQLAAELQNSPAYFRLNGDSQSGLVIRFTNFVSNNWNDPTNYDNTSTDTGQTPGAPNNPENADLITLMQTGGFTACSGIIFDCKLADAGDLQAPDGITASPIVICAGDDLGAFTADYDQPDENEPQAPGFNYEYAFLITGDDGPDYSILDYSLDGDFNYSVLPEGSYRIWGLSYIQTNGSITLEDFLTGNIATIEDIRQFTACGFDSDLDSLNQAGQVVEAQVVAAPTAVEPADPLQSCSGQSTAVFDLTTYDALIRNGSALPVVWYSDAAATQMINDPGNYQAPAGTVYARLENASCSSNTVSVDLEVGAGLDIQIQVDQNPDCDDPLGAISLNITDPTGLGIDWSNNDWDGQVAIDNVAPGTYSVTVTDSNGCRDTSMVRLTSSSTVIAEYVGTNPSCLSPASGTINLSEIIGGSSPYEISFNGGAYESAENWFKGGLTEGNYTIILRDGTGCESGQSVQLRLPAGPALNLGPDIELMEGESAFIVPTTSASLSDLTFTPQTGITAERDGFTFQPDQTTTYTFSVTNANGCTTTDEITITVKPDMVDPPPVEQEDSKVYIPNAFSPNEDGVNDTFTVFGDVDVANVKSMRIFDRWGNLMHEATDLAPNDIQQGWRGMNNGKPLTTGMYVYFVELEYVDGTSEILKGEVMLMR